jgi:hypothetical protein
MKIRIQRNSLVMAALVLMLAACGGGDESPPVTPPAPPPPPPSGTLVGAAGGTVTGPNGAQLVIPAGALASEVRINIEQNAAGAPPLPGGFAAGGLMFAITPHGTTFALPVTVTLPFDPALVPAGSVPALYKTNAQNQWEQIPGATFGASSVSAQISSFSIFAPLVPPLVAGKPVREWSFHDLRGDALEEVELDADIQIDGVLHELFDFGVAQRDGDVFDPDGTSLPPDGIATGQIVSTADGGTYWVGTEAPSGIAAIETDPIGSATRLTQTQSFIKRAANASLTLTLSAAFMETTDANGTLGRGCPAHHTDGLHCDMINADLFFQAQAFTVPAAPDITPFNVFFDLGGSAALTGLAGSWNSEATTAAFSMVPLWSVENFDFVIEPLEGHSEALVLMILRASHPYAVDLSSVEVGEAFTVQISAFTKAYNRARVVNGRGSEFETSARAFLGDPLTDNVASLSFDGLEAIDTPLPVPQPVRTPVPPEPCVPGPGPDPAAGVIQFSEASYSQAESRTTPTIAVSRTGGSTGAVTVTFTTSNGSAIAGTDYTAVNATVFFADGDAVTRTVEVPITQDLLSAEPDKTVNLTLSQPGGCAALGARTTAVLTIRDDDAPPPPTLFTVGGAVTGYTSTGLVLENHIGLFLPIAGNGPFTFSNIPSPSGTAYFVRVFNQPNNGAFQTQACTVTNGSGTFGNANVTNVVVTCEDL